MEEINFGNCLREVESRDSKSSSVISVMALQAFCMLNSFTSDKVKHLRILDMFTRR